MSFCRSTNGKCASRTIVALGAVALFSMGAPGADQAGMRVRSADFNRPVTVQGPSVVDLTRVGLPPVVFAPTNRSVAPEGPLPCTQVNCQLPDQLGHGTGGIIGAVAMLARRDAKTATTWPLWALGLPIGAAAIRSIGHVFSKIGMESIPDPYFAGLVAFMSGALGQDTDLTQIKERELEEVRAQINRLKRSMDKRAAKLEISAENCKKLEEEIDDAFLAKKLNEISFQQDLDDNNPPGFDKEIQPPTWDNCGKQFTERWLIEQQRKINHIQHQQASYENIHTLKEEFYRGQQETLNKKIEFYKKQIKLTKNIYSDNKIKLQEVRDRAGDLIEKGNSIFPGKQSDSIR